VPCSLAVCLRGVSCALALSSSFAVCLRGGSPSCLIFFPFCCVCVCVRCMCAVGGGTRGRRCGRGYQNVCVSMYVCVCACACACACAFVIMYRCHMPDICIHTSLSPQMIHISYIHHWRPPSKTHSKRRRQGKSTRHSKRRRQGKSTRHISFIHIQQNTQQDLNVSCAS